MLMWEWAEEGRARSNVRFESVTITSWVLTELNISDSRVLVVRVSCGLTTVCQTTAGRRVHIGGKWECGAKTVTRSTLS